MTAPALADWTAARRARADAFARDTFGLRGTLRLHGAALGWDLLRAPLNILLAALYLIQRLAALLLSALRLPRAAAWLRDHPLLLRTAVQARVEQALLTHFLDTPGPDAATALLSAPRCALSSAPRRPSPKPAPQPTRPPAPSPTTPAPAPPSPT